MKELTCVISARLGSTRTPRKMVRPFAGSSLLEVLLRKLQRVRNLEPGRLWLSAYEDEIRAVGEKVGVKIYRRTYESTLEPNTCDVIYRYAWDIPSEYFMVVNGCNPLVSVETIERAIDEFQRNDCRSLFTVLERRNFFFDKDGERHELNESVPRAISEETYWDNQKILGSRGRPRPSKNKNAFGAQSNAANGAWQQLYNQQAGYGQSQMLGLNQQSDRGASGTQRSG